MKPNVDIAMPMLSGGRPRPPVKSNGKCWAVWEGGMG